MRCWVYLIVILDLFKRMIKIVFIGKSDFRNHTLLLGAKTVLISVSLGDHVKVHSSEPLGIRVYRFLLQKNRGVAAITRQAHFTAASKPANLGVRIVTGENPNPLYSTTTWQAKPNHKRRTTWRV
jgi:hypothetical protein